MPVARGNEGAGRRDHEQRNRYAAHPRQACVVFVLGALDAPPENERSDAQQGECQRSGPKERLAVFETLAQ
ncbi:hypothetical protein D3C76_812880 [compost metagenome]